MEKLYGQAEAVYRFDCEDWCNSFIDFEGPISFDKLYKILRRAKWAATKKQIRFETEPETGDILVFSTYSCGDTVPEHLSQRIPKIGNWVEHPSDGWVLVLTKQKVRWRG